MSRTTCSCPNKKCFQGTCDCLIRNAVCCSGCNCGGDCQNDLSLGTINPAAAQGTTPTLASGSSANQAATAQAAAQPQPKPLPAQEPESKGEARNTSPSAFKMKFVVQGCSCRTKGCNHHSYPCFTRDVGCTSNCKCPATICVNPLGAKGDESNAQPGGQQGTNGTPDEAVLEQESQIVQPRDTSSLVSTMSERTCGCTNSDCFQSCVCYTTNVICSPDCKCHGHCLHSVVKRWSAAQGTTPTLASGSSTAQGISQTQPLVLISSAAQAAAQTLPSSSVVAALAPDMKTKALPAREPGSTRKPCRCDESKCENRDCVCFRVGLPCCDRCEWKDCENTKTSEKLQDRGIKREVPASGSRTSTMTAGAALAAKESAVGCNCQSECASGCGCVKGNIRCTSICKCKPRCGNDDGSRFTNKSKAGPGGQGGTRSSSSAVESTG